MPVYSKIQVPKDLEKKEELPYDRGPVSVPEAVRPISEFVRGWTIRT